VGLSAERRDRLDPVNSPPPDAAWPDIGVAAVASRREEVNEFIPLIQLVLVLVVVGLALWLINQFIPMAGSIKTILNVVVVIVVILWLLNIFGVISYFPNINMGR
jgi:hypothetical protein